MLIMSIKNGVKGRDSRLNELYSARSKGLKKRKRDSRILLESWKQQTFHFGYKEDSIEECSRDSKRQERIR